MTGSGLVLANWTGGEADDILGSPGAPFHACAPAVDACGTRPRNMPPAYRYTHILQRNASRSTETRRLGESRHAARRYRRPRNACHAAVGVRRVVGGDARVRRARQRPGGAAGGHPRQDAGAPYRHRQQRVGAGGHQSRADRASVGEHACAREDAVARHRGTVSSRRRRDRQGQKGCRTPEGSAVAVGQAPRPVARLHRRSSHLRR